MILLNGAAANGDQIILNSNSAGFANIHIHASYVDYNNANSLVTPAANDLVISANVANQIIVPAVANANNVRNVKTLVIHNANASANNTVVVQVANGTSNANLFVLYSYVLNAGETLQYYDGINWTVLDINGNIKGTTLSPGRILKQTWLTAAAAAQTFTTLSTSGNVWVRMAGAGGAGGCCNGVASNSCAGGGGGAGAYCEVFCAVLPSTGYTYNVGQGGNAVAGNSNGNAGGATNISIGGTLYNANGGAGGVAMATQVTANTQVAGGVGGVVGTQGNINTAGQNGQQATRISANNVSSGSGGSNPQFGEGGWGKQGLGGSAAVNGENGAGSGSGGAGGICVGGVATNSNGGNGTNGLLTIFEYA
jgi:hypothetical protein